MDLSEYKLEPLRKDADFILYRGQRLDQSGSVLALVPVSGQVNALTLQKLEREGALSEELDSAWAAKPLALARHQGRTVLMLDDPGGVSLNGLLGQLLAMTHFLAIAIKLAAALNEVHQRGLIHTDIRPANILVSDSGGVWLTGFGLAICRSIIEAHGGHIRASKNLPWGSNFHFTVLAAAQTSALGPARYAE